MMRRVFLSIAAVALGGLVAYPLAFAGGQRSDCPGTVVCPITGDEVCKDRCPLIDADRTDCPGKIECPVTGELVCRDDCPLDATSTESVATTPSCCRALK